MFDDTTFRLDNEQIRIMQHFFGLHALMIMQKCAFIQ